MPSSHISSVVRFEENRTSWFCKINENFGDLKRNMHFFGLTEMMLLVTSILL